MFLFRKREILESFAWCEFIHSGIGTAISFVYALTDAEIKKPMWDYFKRMAENIHTLWIIMGDFNVIGADSEKQGGAASLTKLKN